MMKIEIYNNKAFDGTPEKDRGEYFDYSIFVVDDGV